MKFTLQHKDPSSRARAGELETDHGTIRTPIFMPVGTAATVKGIFHRDVRDEARGERITLTLSRVMTRCMNRSSSPMFILRWLKPLAPK